MFENKSVLTWRRINKILTRLDEGFTNMCLCVILCVCSSVSSRVIAAQLDLILMEMGGEETL